MFQIKVMYRLYNVMYQFYPQNRIPKLVYEFKPTGRRCWKRHSKTEQF